jgi:putative hydrolase of the HAD superfamily
MRSPAKTRALLFDLGGVVLHTDFDRSLQAWAPHSQLPLARLRELFQVDEPYRRHETGRLPAEGYFDHLRELLALRCDAATLQAGFNASLVAEIDETVRLLAAVRRRVPCYAISNTNAVHLAHMELAFPRLLPHFTRVFASHEIGARKPDPEAFTHVLRAIGMAAPEVLLFDDLLPNVQGAQACGLQAVLVRRPEDVRSALLERGLLASGDNGSP